VFRGLLALVALLSLVAAVLPVRAGESFLEPDQAFRLDVDRVDGRTLALRYDIAPGYYLYRERFEIRVLAPGVTPAPAFPAGLVKYDETFQKDVEIFHDTLRVPVVLDGLASAPSGLRLAVTSQGCADKGLCYPPRTHVLALDVAGGTLQGVRLLGVDEGGSLTGGTGSEPASAVAGANSAASVMGDTFGAALRSGSLWTVAGVFLLAGVLLSFTPCVLPMVPILSSIIVGQGGTAVSRGRALLLSGAYALGMALVYTGFGVAAGLAGEGLAAALQTPWVLGAFAALLVVLSLSMFGLYELQLPAAWQTRLSGAGERLQGGRLGGVFLMGGLSALIVGPCVAAPLAGALVYISQTRDVLLGGVALFAMACGMSVPLLLVGLSAGTLLPRAGAWMEAVKRLFGLMLLAVAVWMVAPLLPTAVAMVAWGALALAAAGVCGLLRPWPAPRTWQGGVARLAGLLFALVGLAQLVGGLTGGRDALRPWAHLTGAASPAEGHALPFRRVRSTAELDEAVRAAAAAGRPVMFDFYADWCVSCKEMERFTFSVPAVQARLAGAVLLQVDVTANNDDDRALLRRFGLFGPPAILFFDATGRELTDRRVIGFQDADTFLASLGAAGIR
jgi:thiol:disulfide interchange protein DsbD